MDTHNATLLCPERSPASGYVLAVLVVAVAAFARWSLDPLLGVHTLFILFTLPVLVAGWWGGLGPGLLATVLSGGIAAYLFLDPFNTLMIADPTDWVRLALFIAVGVLSSILTDALRQARRRSEVQREQLRASEVRLRRIIDGVFAFIGELTSDGTVTEVNLASLKLADLTREDVIGKKGWDCFWWNYDPAVQARLRDAFTRAMQGEAVRYDETVRIANDGRMIVDFMLQPVVEAGRVVAVIPSGVDVTARRRAEKALRANEERLRLILESARDFAIFTVGADRRMTAWSPGAVNIFGYTEAEILGQCCDLIFTSEDRAANVPAREIEEARREGRAEDERWHVRKDGSQFFASGVVAPLGPGGACGFVKVLRDLTERKRTEDELRRARDELEERVAERTRELTATLTSLEAEMARRAELARRLATAQEEERRRLARDLHDTVGQTLTGLSFAAAAGRLEQVKALAITLGRELHEVAVRLRPTALDDVGLEAAVRVLCEAWSRQTGVPVEFHADGFESHRLPTEVETALYRVVQEALTNTARYAAAKRVSVVIGRRNGEALAVVEDDGAGFELSEVRTATPDRRGGLGLAGMRERVTLLGGTVEVESEPGHGTTVIARIPEQDSVSSDS